MVILDTGPAFVLETFISLPTHKHLLHGGTSPSRREVINFSSDPSSLTLILVFALCCHSTQQGYGAFAYMLADFKRLVEAEVFVGTFSSNVGRLMVVLREAGGTKSRESSISVDTPNWWPGRG